MDPYLLQQREPPTHLELREHNNNIQPISPRSESNSSGESDDPSRANGFGGGMVIGPAVGVMGGTVMSNSHLGLHIANPAASSIAGQHGRLLDMAAPLRREPAAASETTEQDAEEPEEEDEEDEEDMEEEEEDEQAMDVNLSEQDASEEWSSRRHGEHNQSGPWPRSEGESVVSSEGESGVVEDEEETDGQSELGPEEDLDPRGRYAGKLPHEVRGGIPVDAEHAEAVSAEEEEDEGLEDEAEEEEEDEDEDEEEVQQEEEDESLEEEEGSVNQPIRLRDVKPSGNVMEPSQRVALRNGRHLEQLSGGEDVESDGVGYHVDDGGDTDADIVEGEESEREIDAWRRRQQSEEGASDELVSTPVNEDELVAAQREDVPSVSRPTGVDPTRLVAAPVSGSMGVATTGAPDHQRYGRTILHNVSEQVQRSPPSVQAFSPALGLSSADGQQYSLIGVRSDYVTQANSTALAKGVLESSYGAPHSFQATEQPLSGFRGGTMVVHHTAQTYSSPTTHVAPSSIQSPVQSEPKGMLIRRHATTPPNGQEIPAANIGLVGSSFVQGQRTVVHAAASPHFVAGTSTEGHAPLPRQVEQQGVFGQASSITGYSEGTVQTSIGRHATTPAKFGAPSLLNQPSGTMPAASYSAGGMFVASSLQGLPRGSGGLLNSVPSEGPAKLQPFGAKPVGAPWVQSELLGLGAQQTWSAWNPAASTQAPFAPAESAISSYASQAPYGIAGNSAPQFFSPSPHRSVTSASQRPSWRPVNAGSMEPAKEMTQMERRFNPLPTIVESNAAAAAVPWMPPQEVPWYMQRSSTTATRFSTGQHAPAAGRRSAVNQSMQPGHQPFQPGYQPRQFGRQQAQFGYQPPMFGQAPMFGRQFDHLQTGPRSIQNGRHALQIEHRGTGAVPTYQAASSYAASVTTNYGAQLVARHGDNHSVLNDTKERRSHKKHHRRHKHRHRRNKATAEKPAKEQQEWWFQRLLMNFRQRA